MLRSFLETGSCGKGWLFLQFHWHVECVLKLHDSLNLPYFVSNGVVIEGFTLFKLPQMGGEYCGVHVFLSRTQRGSLLCQLAAWQASPTVTSIPLISHHALVTVQRFLFEHEILSVCSWQMPPCIKILSPLYKAWAD